MKFRIGWLVVILLFIGLGVYVYNFFNEGESITEHLNRKFTLSVGDIAKIEDEVYIKLIDIKDERCKESDCEREGQKVAKVVTIKNPYIRIVEIGSLTQEEINIKKSDYTLRMLSISEDDKATFEVLGELEEE